MKIWGVTDVGMVRQANEDAYLIFQDEEQGKALCVICDGMGGANAGEVASKTALEAFVGALIQEGKLTFSAENMEEQLAKAVDNANRRIFNLAGEHPEYAGMGTTLVCMLCVGEKLVIGNVGDSRAYRIEENGMTQITRDHSLVGEMLRRGEITPSEAFRHPNRNLITRVLGPEKEVECDIFCLTSSADSFILLCSDGLTGEVTEPEIFFEVMNASEPQPVCENLLAMANDRGGHDNTTIILVAL